MTTVLEDLCALLRRRARGGYAPTEIPRLALVREIEAGDRQTGMVLPRMCLTVQGAKSIAVGAGDLVHGAGQYVVSAIEVPAIFEVAEASRERPYLGVSLSFDPALIADILLEMPEAEESPAGPGLGVSGAAPALLDACLRLLRLLDAPGEIPVLAPLVEREILFRLLQGPQGAKIRRLSRADTHLTQLRRVLSWMRENHARPFRVDDLARMAGMSASAFHRHFRTTTLMTPIQYQKRLRLCEARQKLLAEPGNVARVAFAVGYESASQFSRDYARLFGLPPVRDRDRVLAGGAVDEAALRSGTA